MKIFFQPSNRAKDQYIDLYVRIFNELKKDYTLVDDETIRMTQDDFYKQFEKGGREAHENLYERKVRAIQESDICIFEATVPSFGIGFLIQKSLDFSKPTIVLYLKEHIPVFLVGVKSDKLLIQSYNEKNFKKILKESLELARERRDKRFNFFLSPKLLDYLEGASKKEGVTKSKLIRDMIVHHMRKNISDELSA